MPNDVKDPFWINSARSLLTGAILHFFNENLSFVETIEKITSMSATKLINELVSSSANQVINYISGFVKMDEKTLASIYMELHNHINLYVTDIDIKNSLSVQNCICPEDLENGQDIYVTLPEYRLEAWKNMFSLMISQFLTHFEKRPDGAKTPILFLLDEFPRLGKNEKIAHALATLNGKNITMCLIVQYLPQLVSIYGENIRNSMCGNCDYKVVLKATDGITQKYFSELVGTYERQRIGKGKNRPALSILSGTSENEILEEKRLIRPEEFSTLPDIILLTPHKAHLEHSGFYRIDRKPYYQ